MASKKTVTLAFAAFALSAAVFTSCGDKENEGGETQPAIDTTKASVEIEETTTSLPSPLLVAGVFKKSGLKYISNLPNSPDNVSKYTSGTKYTQTTNLGVYSSDMAYAVLNKQNQEAKNYMLAAKKLSESLGIDAAFREQSLADRFEKNLGNEDSLGSIIADIQMQTDDLLREGDREYISAMIFAGAWVESMYIGSQAYDKSKEKNLAGKLTEQMIIVESILKVLKKHQDKESSIPALIADLESVKNIFDGFEEIKKLKESEEDIDYSSIQLKDEELSRITQKITEIRTKIVNG